MPVYKPVFDRDSVSPKKGEDYIGETEAASQHIMFRHNKMLPAESFLKQNLRRNGGRSEERRAHSVTPSIILKDENSVLGPEPIIFDDHSKPLDYKTSYLLRLSKRGNSKGGQLASLQVTSLQRQKEERAKQSQMKRRFSKTPYEDEPHGIGFVPSTPWTHLAGEYLKSGKPITQQERRSILRTRGGKSPTRKDDPIESSKHRSQGTITEERFTGNVIKLKPL